MLLVGMQNDAASEVAEEDSLAISCKTKHTLTIVSNNHTSWYLPKYIEDYICTHTHTHSQMFMAALFIIAKTWK